ncbi:MAG: hypothetical protein EBR67_03965 [Proteobacteria bacterium]|jgi:hypothetical protein|nr:hypothetical protein [Pseudomonadota bacterium]
MPERYKNFSQICTILGVACLTPIGSIIHRYLLGDSIGSIRLELAITAGVLGFIWFIFSYLILRFHEKKST